MRQSTRMRLDATVLSSTTHNDHLLLVVSADNGPAMFIQIDMKHLAEDDALPEPGDLVHVDGELTGGSMVLVPSEFRVSPMTLLVPTPRRERLDLRVDEVASTPATPEMVPAVSGTVAEISEKTVALSPDVAVGDFAHHDDDHQEDASSHEATPHDEEEAFYEAVDTEASAVPDSEEVAPIAPDTRATRVERLFSWLPSDAPAVEEAAEEVQVTHYYRDSVASFGQGGLFRGPFRLIPSEQDLLIPV